ncbi:MAG: ABC transporter ATP-binding protein [Gammaproteobacteria bacterium]|nr:ABC transporter ATP-binding protein [Gammaproteobacteria bacterium]
MTYAIPNLSGNQRTVRPVIQLEGVSKAYSVGDASIVALNNVSLTIYPGEFVAVTGASGSGKSTLMSLIGCLDRPDQGNISLADEPLGLINDNRVAAVRNRKIGFIFQSFNLIPRLTALHNVELPMIYAGIPPAQRLQRAKIALQIVGMQDRALHSPSQLSGGQQQRIAIARALVNNPDVILADEPTGSLDAANVDEVMKLLVQLNKKGKTVVLVTHDMQVANFAERTIFMRDGNIVSDIRR